MNYRDAGVDIERGNRLVERIKPLAASTPAANVLAGIGGFGALYSLPANRFHEPVLVSGADGVGTKVLLAIAADKHDTIGIDLVAMCANDIVVQGAEPLFFLDYFATGRLDERVAETVIAGIAEGCRLAGAALIGGETAEMPGMYADGHYDLAGFCLGVVEKSAILHAARVEAGDNVIGLASSGPHSNGYSLIRRILESGEPDLSMSLGDTTLGEALLAPTRLYVKSILALLKEVPVHAVAHITGGGLTENLPRVLPEFTEARIDSSAWPRPGIFRWIEHEGGVASPEMFRTFNCGVGMAVCVPAAATDAAVNALARLGETAWVIGDIVAAENRMPEVLIS